MNPTAPKNISRIFTLLLPLFVLLIVPAAARAQSYTPEETKCYNLVQGKIPWNAAGNTSWGEGNLRNLCKGTTNASATVSCFSGKISSGLTWDKAMAGCAPAPSGTEFCAKEGERCQFTGTREVKYGARGTFFTKTLANGATCNTTTFGGDPTPNVLKQCYLVSLGAEPAPTTIGNEEDLAQKLVERGNEGPVAGANLIQRPYIDNLSKISLISDNGMRMSRCKNCQQMVPGMSPETVVLSSDPLGYFSTFEIELVEGGKTRDTAKSVLRTDTGDTFGYCSGCVVGNIAPEMIGMMGPTYAYNRFELGLLSNGKYSLKASNGKYVGRCAGCSPSFAVRTGGINTVAPIYADASSPLAQWSIEVVGPPSARFPSNPNDPIKNFIPDPQGLFTKSNAQLEKDCADQVQGVVAWDRAGSKTWDKTTLTRLCRVTQNPWETIACFKLKLQESGDLETSINACGNSPDSYGFLQMVHSRRNSGVALPPSEVPNANQPLDSSEMGLMMSWIATEVNAIRSPFCWKNSYTRTGGTNPPTPGGPCPAGKELSGTTCFPKCSIPGYDGVSLVCWQRCPSHTPTSCGMGCARDASTCGWTIFDQVSGPLAIVVFAASKGGSSDKTVAAGAAVNAGKMERAIASIKKTVKATEVGLDAALATKKGFASVQQLVDTVKATKEAVGAVKSTYTLLSDATEDFVSAYTADFAVQTSPEIERRINERFGPRGAAEIKRQWALNHLNATLSYSMLRDMKDVLSIISVFDPTGITATLNAYSHPVCAKDTPFPTVHPRYLD